MDRQLGKQHSDRVVSIGREGNPDGFDELLDDLQSSSANVRRLSASALGKLAWLGVDQQKTDPLSATGQKTDFRLSKRSSHPQSTPSLKTLSFRFQPVVRIDERSNVSET